MRRCNIRTKGEVVKVNTSEGVSVLWCDSVYITSSKFGAALTFAQDDVQRDSKETTQTVVAQIGFSREHLYTLMKIIQATLVQMGVSKEQDLTRK